MTVTTEECKKGTSMTWIYTSTTVTMMCLWKLRCLKEEKIKKFAARVIAFHFTDSLPFANFPNNSKFALIRSVELIN